MFSTTGKNLRSSLIIILTSATLFLSSAPATLARAYFGTRLEMERSATEIALVKIEKCEPCRVKFSNWTYGSKSEATVLKTLKGTLPPKITIYGQEDFRCAQCNFPEGTSLVFLKKDLDHYCGANWGYSCLKVNGKNTQWLEKPDSHKIIETSLEQALTEIKNDLEALPQLDKLSEPAKLLLITPVFSNRVVGMAYGPSRVYLAYQKLKEAKTDAKAEILLVSKFGKAAGKLYAGILLTHINTDEGRTLLKSYLNNQEELTTQQGCVVGQDWLGNASKKALENGSYNGIELGK